MTLLRHIEACNRFDPADFVPFAIAGQPIGLIRPAMADYLRTHDLAAIVGTGVGTGVGIAGGNFAAASAQLALIVTALSAAGLMGKPRGELTPVLFRWGDEPVAAIDRAGLPALGLPAFGVHVNGFTGDAGDLKLWIGRRAMDRLVAPGKLDHLIAGGIPMGLSAHQTLIKEADEEAGLTPEIAGLAVTTGVVTYRLALPEGLRNDCLFVFDLKLPRDIVPANRDGEVASFELWPIAQAIETLRTTDDFKFNVNLVLIDFLIRHGLIGPDDEPDYAALAKGLRR